MTGRVRVQHVRVTCTVKVRHIMTASTVDAPTLDAPTLGTHFGPALDPRRPCTHFGTTKTLDPLRTHLDLGPTLDPPALWADQETFASVGISFCTCTP